LQKIGYHFIEQQPNSPDQIPETRIVCLDQEDKEMGWLQYTGLEYDYCIRIQRLYVKPGFRHQGVGMALINHLKIQHAATPIFAHLIRVDKDVSLNVVIDFFKQNEFDINQIIALEAEAYFNFE